MQPEETQPAGGHQQLAHEMRGRMVSMTRTDAQISDAEMDKLRENLYDYKNSKRDRSGKAASWEKLAQRILGSENKAGVLNAWYNRKYDGDNPKIASQVKQFLDDEADRAGCLPVVECAQIENAKRVNATILEGISGNAIVAIIGPHGCGKTSMKRLLCATRSNVIPVTIDEHSGSKAGMTRKLCEAVLAFQGRSITEMPEKGHERWRIVLDYFRRTRNAVLVVDEVQKLSRGGLEVIRDLHDLSDEEGQRNLPVVLFGDPDFYKLLVVARANGAKSMSGQFARRIAPIFDYEKDGLVGGGTDMYSESDIARILQNERVRLTDANGVRWIKALANIQGFGRLGFAMRVVRTAWSIAGRRPPIGVDHLIAALRMTMGRDVAADIDKKTGGELMREVA